MHPQTGAQTKSGDNQSYKSLVQKGQGSSPFYSTRQCQEGWDGVMQPKAPLVDILLWTLIPRSTDKFLGDMEIADLGV